MYIYECSFDVTNNYCNKYEIVKETEKCYMINKGRVRKSEMDKVNILHDKYGTTFGRIYVIAKDIDMALTKINKIRIQFLLNTVNNMITMRDYKGGDNAKKK